MPSKLCISQTQRALRIKKLNFKEIKLILSHVKILPSKENIIEEGQTMPIQVKADLLVTNTINRVINDEKETTANHETEAKSSL